MSMIVRGLTDANGWMKGVIVQEAPSGWRPSRPRPGEVVLDEEPAIDLALLRVNESGRLSTPHDDRVAWRRLRRAGYGGPEAVALARHRDVAGLADAGPSAGVVVAGGGFEVAYADIPQLRLRPLTADDLDHAVKRAVAIGLYEPACPDAAAPCCRPPEAHPWLHLAGFVGRDDTDALCWEYRGEPLQMEVIQTVGEIAHIGTTIHFTRERPHWFWREAERPVFERLRKRGITTVYSYTRSDRPEWVQVLKDNYGAVEEPGEEVPETVKLRYDVDTALGRTRGWPERKTAAATPPALGIPMPAELSLAEALPLIEQAWPAGSPRLPIARRIAREWSELDRGTILKIGSAVRIVRPRRDGVATIASLTPMTQRDQPAARAIRAWLQAAGYTTLTSFIPERMWSASAAIRNHATAEGFVITRRTSRGRESFVEVEAPV